MLTHSYFGVGFWRGLNSAAEVFAPYSGGDEGSPPRQTRSDWRRLGGDLRRALTAPLASEPLAESRGPDRRIGSIISAHWSGPLPPPAELERLDQVIPGGADRLLRMAEKELENKLCLAEKELESKLCLDEKELESKLCLAEKELESKLCLAEKELESKLCLAEKEQCMAEKEQTHRIEDTKRGQYFGWSLAIGAVIAAAVVSLCHGPWQASVALVGIPVLGTVHSLIQGRKEKSDKRALRWF
jgi:uncharacterized membrane protein